MDFSITIKPDFIFILESYYNHTHSIYTSFCVGRVTALIGGYDMRKITPVMLVLLLVASLMANIDITQLETTEVIEDAGARSGADAELVAITSPKETQCDPECRNEIFVGQDTTFEVFIQNSGDQPITEMGYKAQVWIADGNGNPMMLAKDSTGADLEFNNPDVICDDVSVCADQSLAAGAVFKGGKTTLQYGGGDATWTPAAGIYVIQIETYSDQDVDPGNDVQQVYVEVVDYLDIEIDIEWDDGSVVATGEGAKAFTVTVSLNGSTDFITHNLTMELDISGDVSQATADDGTDLLAATAASLVHSVNVGTDQVVMVYQNESDPTDNITEVRTIMSDNINNGVWTYSGSILPDTTVTEAAYSVDVALGGYSLYGQFESCIETIFVNSTDAEGNDVTTEEIYANFCEEEFNKDDFTRNNADEITGTLSTFHDIRISMLTVNQGYNNDGTGIPTFTVGAGEPGDLSVGVSYVDAWVEHRGSSATELYHWNVTFTITNTDTNEVITATVNECIQGVEPAYNYAMLGTGPEAFDQGHACTMVDFDVGTYTIEAELIMSDSDKTPDQKLSNNFVSMEKEVRNNLPVISSLDLVTQGDLYLGMENMLEFEVSVFDADDVTGEFLTYTWVGGATSTPLAGCGGMGGAARTCTTPVIQEFVTLFPVDVTVTDAHGGSVTETIEVQIWNDAVASDSTASGITMDYSLTYWAKSQFSITVTDGDANECSEITLPDGSGGELSGQYTPVAVVDYEPVTTYSANDVLAQSMDMIFDSGLGASSLWFTTNCDSTLLTQLLADGATNSQDDSTKSVLSAVLNGPVLPAGKFLLIDAPLEQKGAPSASITGFTASSDYNGEIVMNWVVGGTPLSGDEIVITITHPDGTVFEDKRTTDDTGYSYGSQNTNHGDSYDIEVAVCNQDNLCSSQIGDDTVIADKQVDGVSATEVTVTTDYNNSKYIIEWQIDGDLTVDHNGIKMWMVCHSNSAFDAVSMPTTCVETADANALTADVPMPVDADGNPIPGAYTKYFVVVPVDGVDNVANDASSSDSGNEAPYNVVADTGDITNDNTDEDDKQSGELPGWTWGAIGGVVVVAFIAGAFILSRGGGDGEDKDWDY